MLFEMEMVLMLATKRGGMKGKLAARNEEAETSDQP